MDANSANSASGNGSQARPRLGLCRHPAVLGRRADPAQRPQGVSLRSKQRRGRGQVFGPVGVEERVDRLVANATVASRWRAVQRSTLRMPSSITAWRRSSRSRTGHSPITGCACPSKRRRRDRPRGLVDPGVSRATRSLGRNGASVGNADHERAIRSISPPPNQARPARRPTARRNRERCRHHRQAEPGKARRVAIGVEHECRDLRPQPLDDPIEQRHPAEQPQRLVAAAHAPRQPAREQQPDDVHAAFTPHLSARLALRASRGGSSSTGADRRRRRCARRRPAPRTACLWRGRSG